MTRQCSDRQVSSAQGAQPAQIVVELLFTAGASSNTPIYPRALIYWNCLLWAPWAPRASLKPISPRLVKGQR
jgi:hypothetical protein